MPKKTKRDMNRKKQDKRLRADFKDYINVYLRKDEEKELEVWWQDNSPRLIDMLCELAEDGYSVSVKSDTYDDKTHTAAIMGYWADACPVANQGYILSARSGENSIRALAEVLFYHYVVCEGGDWLE